jgi:phosphate-selective porin OprO/OprP
MSRLKLHILCAVSLAAVSVARPAIAESNQARDKIDALEGQLAALQEEIRALKRKVNSTEKTAEKAYAAATPAAKGPPPAATKVLAPPPTAIVKMSAGNRPSICTPDGLNCIALTSRLHLDVGGYSYSPNTAATVPQFLDNGVNARRARIGVLGTFMGDWNYSLIYDFGGSSDGFGGTAPGSLPGGAASGIQTAYLSYQGIKGLAIEGGYTDSLYTLDEATSSNDIMFMERATSQVVASNIAAGDFRSQFGMRWFNDWFWAGAYVTGPTSGAIHSASSVTPPGQTEQYGAFGRVALHYMNDKYWSFHIGGDAQALFQPPLNRVTGAKTLTLSDRPELRIDPTAIITTGAISNVSGAQIYSVEAAGNVGPLYLQGEYFWFNIDRDNNSNLPARKFSGGYVEAGWTITGETRTYNNGNGAYNGIVPANPVTPYGGWGAWEIAFRYSVIDLNDGLGLTTGINGGKQTVYTAGLNWYVNRNIRFMINYLNGEIDKQLSPTNPADVGARFNAVAMRTQVAF